MRNEASHEPGSWAASRPAPGAGGAAPGRDERPVHDTPTRPLRPNIPPRWPNDRLPACGAKPEVAWTAETRHTRVENALTGTFQDY